MNTVDSTRRSRPAALLARLRSHAPSGDVVFDLMALLLIGWLLRLVGVAGVSAVLDEHINQAVRLLSGDLVPRSHYYPQLTNYLNAAACGALFILGRLFGFFSGLGDFRDQYFTNDFPFFLAGRTLQAGIGALIGPIAYLTARHLGHARRVSWLAGVLMAFSAVSVWFGHFAKPQNGMSTSVIGALAFAIVYLDRPGRRGAALGLGFASGVGVAFMHSGVFLLGPIGVLAAIIALTDARYERSAVLRDIAQAVGLGVITWVALFFPNLLFISEFIDYQVIQAKMSLRQSSPALFMQYAFPVGASFTQGLSPIGLLLVPLGLVSSPHRSLKWTGFALGTLTVLLAYRLGARVEPQLLMPFVLTLLLLAYLGFAALRASASLWRRGLGTVGLGGLVLSQCLGTAMVLKTALATPAAGQLASVVRAHATPKTKVLVPDLRTIALRQDAEAARNADARHRRLAEKYGVELPPRADRGAAAGRAGYHLTEIPWVIGGLEFTKPEEVEVVLPYSWPVQYEEWTLDHWLAQDFELVVLWEIDAFLEGPVPDYYKAFYREILDACEPILDIQPHRKLFYDFSYRVLSCREALAAYRSSSSD